MPPISASRRIVARSAVAIDADTLAILQQEDGLLLTECAVRATRQDWRRYDADGALIAHVRHSPQLIYTLAGSTLFPNSENLGNYHPGRALSDRALAFLNAREGIFQFQTELAGARVGTLVYGDPEQTPIPGDLTAWRCTIEHTFIDLDTTTYPSLAPPGNIVTDPDEAGGPWYILSVYWEDANGGARFLRIKGGSEPGLESLYASGLPPAASYAISDFADSSPINAPANETSAGSIADDITITGVYAHNSATWLYTSEGLDAETNHGLEVFIPFWYDAATAGSATTITAGGYWLDEEPPSTRPSTSHARAALWSTTQGWIQTPAPGGPTWTAPANPLTAIPGLLIT